MIHSIVGHTTQWYYNQYIGSLFHPGDILHCDSFHSFDTMFINDSLSAVGTIDFVDSFNNSDTMANAWFIHFYHVAITYHDSFYFNDTIR